MKISRFTNILVLLMIGVLASCAASTDDARRKEKAEALRKLGEAYMAENKTAPAFRKLKEAETLDPEDPYTQFALGIFYFNKKRYDLAIERYKRCLELKPDFASVRNNLGLAYLEKGDYDTAIKHFRELTDNYVYATPHYALTNLGQAYYYKGEFTNAERYLKDALDLKPNFLLAIHWLGRTQLAMGKTKEAIQSFEKAVQLNAGIPEIYFDLGKAYQADRDKDMARNAFQRVIELAPKSEFAKQAAQALQ